jgi:hypothetical protein
MRRWPDPYLFPGQTNGRPRERFYASDFGGAVLDANALRREAKDAGRDITVAPSVRVTWTDREGKTHDVGLEIDAVPHPIYGWRWWLWCPRCWRWRGKLYVAKRGPACRCCLRLGYAR